ncbi:ligand-binding sensor domain-containing diguanylate cyclase [Tahibacter caeni]|uniref:ligand-binding sensor domain-containing diguanylate cyclase n=1 Tax=Tahibacter caeni TaxID=1453545 RepID=UPI00214793A7|nr:diguanylate cyclase [Tahibacter caeni]
MRKFVALALLWAYLAGAAETPAPPPRPLDLSDLGAPSFTNFTAGSGVPNSVTVGVQTDADGFVWLAAPSGLFRYDGRRWSQPDDARLRHSATGLWLDRDGTLWAGFRDDGIARYDGRRWYVENQASGLPSQQIRRFAETREPDGRWQLWALTWDRGLLRRQDGRWLSDAGNAQLPRSAVLTLAQTRSIGGAERLWVGTGEEGLWYRERGGDWQRFRSGGFEASQVEFLLRSERADREELWVSVFGSGLWRLREDGLRRWTRETGELPTNDLYDIAETPLPGGDRAIWVSSRSGLVRVHGDGAQVFDRRYGLPSNGVRGLSAWRSPNGDAVLWLATEAGVSRSVVGANPWLTASLLGDQATGIFGVLVEPDGRGGERLWAGGSEGGLGLYEQGRWRYFTQESGDLPTSSVRMIAAVDDADGRRARWLGLRYGHLLRVRDGPAFEAVDVPWKIDPAEAVLDTVSRRVDGRYEQWFGTRLSGIHRLSDGVWTPYRADGVVDRWRVNRFVEQIDRDGRSWLWAITNQGLARYDGTRWTLVDREAGLVDHTMSGGSLIVDAQGTPVLWIGTANAGIVRVDVGDPLHPRRVAASLPAATDPTAYGALQDSRGRVYVCTNNGVQQLTPDAHGGYVSRVFTRGDGMVHDECNTNGQFLDAHDRFWSGTLGGLTVYDPQRAAADRQAKPLKLVDVQIDGVSTAADVVRIPAAARNVRVDYALLSWQRESESRFRTQLLGYDTEPTAWSADTSRSFGALPPGSYRLRIEARDYAGNLSTPVELPLTMAAQWWQTAWARVGFALALLLAGYALLLWRTRTLENQRNALERRVAARTDELNVANARLRELSYRDALTGLANRRALLEVLEQQAAAGVAERMALVFVDVDHFKDYNDHHGHPAGDEALRCVAEALRGCAPAGSLVARYGGEEFACLLPRGDGEQGMAVAECIRAAVAAQRVPVPGSAQTRTVTISAGVASRLVGGRDHVEQLLRDADAALYQAKHGGRNCVRRFAATRTPG